MGGEVVIVAVDASKEITDYALEWAIRNLIKSMDVLILLALLPSTFRSPSAVPPPPNTQTNYHSPVYQFLSGLVKKKGARNDEQGSEDKLGSVRGHDMARRISNVCVQMMQQLLSMHNVVKVVTEVKVVSDAQLGSVAVLAAEVEATWVVLDQRLKKEADCCLKELNCNVVLIDHAIPNILKSESLSKTKNHNNVEGHHQLTQSTDQSPNSSSTTFSTQSSPGFDSPNFKAEFSLTSSTDEHLSIKSKRSAAVPKSKPANKNSPPVTKFEPPIASSHLNSEFSDHETGTEGANMSSPSYSKSQPLGKVSKFGMEWPPNLSPKESRSRSSLLKAKSDVYMTRNRVEATDSASLPPRRPTTNSPNSLQKLKSPNQSESPNCPRTDRSSSVRRYISLSIKRPPTPPPLCSICKHKAPIFGKAPRKFSYKEIEKATNGFSSANFLAEGGYGSVYRGVLADGQVVAVKQHTMLSAQGASEFCSEVEVLSCAQHKNLVMLVGYCIEKEWLLVYEFACHGSLDKHLYGTETKEVMCWQSRMKVAVGAARGLRYLHEDCRVGCIVHRDFRPTNILLTHDFEPMVGDFGLARWQVDGQSAEETRVIGSFGYMAPEYIQTGLITKKADVYAFGVVLLELITGIKATELSRNVGHQLLLEQGRELLEGNMYNDIIDPRLQNNYINKEVECMLLAALLCISPHPEQRPRISEVLKILEGDMRASHRASSDDHRQSTAAPPKQKLDGYIYSKDRTSNSPIHRMQSTTHHPINSSPSGESNNIAQRKINNDQKRFEPFKYGASNGRLDLNHSEIVNQEYQEYLQESLSKFIGNLIVK